MYSTNGITLIPSVSTGDMKNIHIHSIFKNKEYALHLALLGWHNCVYLGSQASRTKNLHCI